MRALAKGHNADIVYHEYTPMLMKMLYSRVLHPLPDKHRLSNGSWKRLSAAVILTSAARLFVAVVSEPGVTRAVMAAGSAVAGSISADCLINHTCV